MDTRYRPRTGIPIIAGKNNGGQQQETKSRYTNMLLLTADEFMQKGLELGGFDIQRQARVGRKTNLERFKGLYGSNCPMMGFDRWS